MSDRNSYHNDVINVTHRVVHGVVCNGYSDVLNIGREQKIQR